MSAETLPPPDGYKSWLEAILDTCSINRDAKHAARAELAELMRDHEAIEDLRKGNCHVINTTGRSTFEAYCWNDMSYFDKDPAEAILAAAKAGKASE